MISTVSNLFSQLDELIKSLTTEQYSRSVPLLQHASIGQHLRHIIELYQELVNGYPSGIVDYEKRKRNLLLETDKEIALQEMSRLIQQLKLPCKSLQLNTNLSAENKDAFSIRTTFQREFLYNIEHTIHHMAIIRIAVSEVMNISIPQNFGVSPATIKYRLQCAQ